jgi:hypothetical protein
MTAFPKLVHTKFAQKRVLPKKSGDTVVFRRYSRIPTVPIPLVDGITPPGAPQAASWTDSVICTELHRQGRMPTHIYLKDAEYGILLEQYYPEVLEGYHLLAKPVVKLMRASKLFSKLISYPALRWAYYIAGEEESILGACIFHIGQPICAIIGKIKRLGVKYVPFCNN